MPILASSEKGSAPVLAVFTIFILLSCALAISSFQGSDQRSVSATQQLVAADVTRATASAIEGELNHALVTAVTAAMYDAGGASGNCGDVERLTLDYLNLRISHGWSYPNLEVIIPEISGDDMIFEWQPDGSVEVQGYLDAEIRHVCGPTAHGVKLKAFVNPRFERLRSVALRVLEENSGALESDRYAAEGLEVELRENDDHVTAVVTDVFASPCAMVGSSMDFIRYIASKEITSPPPITPPSPPPSPPPSQPPSPPPQPSGDFTLSVSPSSGAVAREFGPTKTGTMTFSLPIPSMSWGVIRYEDDLTRPIYGWATIQVPEVVGYQLMPVYGWKTVRVLDIVGWRRDDRYAREDVMMPIYGWVTRQIWDVISYERYPIYGWVTRNVWKVVGYERKPVYDWVLEWRNFSFDVPIYGDRYPSKGTSATVTITPIGSYSHEVSLSLAAPGEVNASLGSRSLKPNPHDVSTPLTVDVPMSEDSRTGTYVINVVGVGADGKRREASYTLNVEDTVARVARIEPVSITLGSGPPLGILPVYDGGSKVSEGVVGGYVLPYQFLSDKSSGFTRPFDPELAKLFGVPGYVDPKTGEVRPFLVDELSDILLERPPWTPEEK